MSSKLEVCEFCGKRQKYYRSAFGSWFCYNCRKETLNVHDKQSGWNLALNSWWNNLKLDQKQKLKDIYEEDHK